MDVGASSCVVSQIPTVVVRIVVDHDLVAIPKPVVGVSIVKWSHTEGKAAYPEALPVPALNPKDMAWAKAGRKASMLKRPVQVKAGIIPARIMTHPRAVRVNVRSFRMSLAIANPVAFNGGFLSRLWCSLVFHTHRRGPMRWNKS